MDQNETYLELSANQMAAIVYGMTSLFAGCVKGVTHEPDIAKIDPVDRESFEAATLEIIEDRGIKPRELHANWVVTTQKMIEDNALEQISIAKLKPYMVSFNELPLHVRTMYRLQVQITRNLIRYNRNGKRENERQRQRQRISGGSMAVRKRGVSGRPT